MLKHHLFAGPNYSYYVHMTRRDCEVPTVDFTIREVESAVVNEDGSPAVLTLREGCLGNGFVKWDGCMELDLGGHYCVAQHLEDLFGTIRKIHSDAKLFGCEVE